MQEKIAKVASLNAEIAKAITAGNTDEAIAKLAEATTELEGLSTDAEAIETQEVAIEKKMQTEIKKWADLYVTAESFAELLVQFKEATALLATLDPIMKSVPDLVARLETVEKTTTGSNQTVSATPIQKNAGSIGGELSGFFSK